MTKKQVLAGTSTAEAQQWFPPGEPGHDPSMLSHRKGNAVDPPDYLQAWDIHQFSQIKGMGDDIFQLRNDRGDDIRLLSGDWVVHWDCGARSVFSDNHFRQIFGEVVS